jgi:hypothetical protein
MLPGGKGAEIGRGVTLSPCARVPKTLGGSEKEKRGSRCTHADTTENLGFTSHGTYLTSYL